MEISNQLVEEGPDAVLVKTPTEIVYANRAAITLFGALGPEELIGRPALDLIAPEDHEEVLGLFLPLFQGQGGAVRLEKSMVRLDGVRVDVEIAAAPLLFQGQPSVQAVIRDVTERRMAVLAQSRLAAIIASAQDAILTVTPDGTVVGWNPGAQRLYGYAEGEIIGHSLARLLTHGTVGAAHQSLGRVLASGQPEWVETAHLRKDGTLVEVSVTVSAILGEDGKTVGAAAMVRDITERRLSERRIAEHLQQLQEYATILEDQKGALEAANAELERLNARLDELASTDGLTVLMNHRVFGERLAEEFRRARRYSEPLSLILLDVDRFKAYNDTFGHLAGNSVLKGLAEVLRDHARETDLVARFGGEEFALILPHTGLDVADALAERLRGAVEGRVWSASSPITASFGVCELTPEVCTPEGLIACADAALYRAKTGGRNRVERV